MWGVVYTALSNGKGGEREGKGNGQRKREKETGKGKGQKGQTFSRHPIRIIARFGQGGSGVLREGSED